MTNDVTLRLQFLVRVVGKESHYLLQTSHRLFSQPINTQFLADLDSNIALSEQLDAFASRFGRLQDNIGDKLLPAVLTALATHLAAARRMALLPGPADALARALPWGGVALGVVIVAGLLGAFG